MARLKMRPTTARIKKNLILFCSVAHVGAVYSQSRRLGIEVFQSRRSRDYLRSHRLHHCLRPRRSRRFFESRWSRQSSIAKFRSRRSGIAKFGSRLSFLRSRNSTRASLEQFFSLALT